MQTTESVRKACDFIASRAAEPLTLAAVAAHVNASPYHFQRVFTRVVGLSPRAYQEALRAGRFRRRLRAGVPVAGALYDAGYGSTSRVYEGRPTGRGMTPATYRRGGAGVAARPAAGRRHHARDLRRQARRRRRSARA
jgi:AraC family transcriptional regulator of adaptative response/methylated-DNA-[protein]-cysteine methyltransferase